MKVKVLMLPETDAKVGKVEYFNDIYYWDVDGRILHLYKQEDDGDTRKVATIMNWTWIKEDE